ncbi:GumC family protein [Roseibium sp.]|uniref:GumC family protein n=1 Tax=Roseibium sp. TaxID=1936156 RepID=UPI003A9827CF
MSSTRSGAHDDDMALDLAGLVRSIGGAMRWLLPLVLCVAVGTFMVLQFVPAKYKGEARVLIESKDADYPGATRGVEEERALLDNEGVASQVQLLMSADLARRVAKRLELVSVAEFEAGGDEGVLNDALVMLGLARDPSKISPEERVLKVFYENLEIYRVEGSRVIAVEFSSRDPELAAAVANTIVDEYISLQSSAKRETTEIATTSLEPQIERMKAEVQAARKAVADFRARADLFVGTDNLTLNQQQLAQISSSYSAAQATKAEAQAKADLIRELLQSGGSLETASDVLDSLLIQRLRERQVAIQSNIAELSITLLPNHPQLKALQSQLDDYNRQIRSEARKVLVGLENDAKVSAQQAEALKARLGELKKAAAQTNSDQVRLSELEREADAKARQLDEMISSFRDADTRLRAQALPADARVISRAAIPIEPYSPKVLAITIIAALATFVLGCAYVIMREFMSGNVLYAVDYGPRETPVMPRGAEPRSPGASWAEPSGPSIAMSSSYSFGGYRDAAAKYVKDVAAQQPVVQEDVRPVQNAPAARSAKAQPSARRLVPTYDQDVARDWLEAPQARLREMDEALEAAPGVSTGAEAPEVDGLIVVLTIDDAKLSHERAFALARQAADDGSAALMMEVFPDVEAPEAAPGFSDLVAGNAVFSRVVYNDPKSRAHIIEAGTRRIDDEIVDSDRFNVAMEAVSDTYDTIVVDLGVIDGSQASAAFLREADRVLLMSSGNGHGRELESAARLLAHNTGAEVEVVLAGDGKTRRKGRGRAA